MVFDLLTTRLWPLAVALVVWLGFKVKAKQRRARSLPPGPKGLPVLGNLLQIPQEESWVVFNEWAKQYGDVTYLNALGTDMVILNTLEAIDELLNKRANNYSDRPDGAVEELMEMPDWALPMMHHGPEWRLHRRTFHQFFGKAYVSQFDQVIEQELSAHICRLFQNPKDFRELTRVLFGSILLRISYGIEDEQYSRKLAEDVDGYMRDFFEYITPGRFLVGLFPALRYVPSWFPGAGWKKLIQGTGALGHELRERPFGDSAARLRSGQHGEHRSVAGMLIEQLPDGEDPEYTHRRQVAANISGIAYTAGADTSSAGALAAIFALAMHPEVQRKAQAEIYSVVGNKRLPTCQDVENMPYVQAIVKEVNRWNTVVPHALPHTATKDDYYKGYLIPAGCVILPNSWAVMHDPQVFENPMEFNPDRYMKDGKINPDVMSPEAAAFGYGRRKCPGRHLSFKIQTLTIASMLAVFDIKPPLDEQGNPKELTLKCDNRFQLTPLPFECRITPRAPCSELRGGL